MEQNSEFIEQSNAFRRRCRMGRWFHKGGTYVKPKIDGEIKGKAAIKAAKRARVAQRRFDALKEFAEGIEQVLAEGLKRLAAELEQKSDR